MVGHVQIAPSQTNPIHMMPIARPQKKSSEKNRLQDKYEQDIKTMREEIRKEMKKQQAQLVTQ